MTAIITRSLLYLLWGAAAAQVALLEARQVNWQNRFTELGYVETLQAMLLAASAILLFWMTRARRQQAQLAFCGALVFSILFIRENDQVLELFLPHGVWKWPALLLAVVLTWQCLRHRDAIMVQVHSLSSTPAWGVYLAAGSTLVFSRLFGRKMFWEVVMDERYFRLVKTAAEEGTELFALGLFFAGTVEWVLSTGRADDR
ncbi:MAG: hypothetical protein GWP58_03785 [Gammaproteobacteria bacterium]|nr:hypothetical protein [Gammaproteobacteria bacterium]